MRTCRNVHYYSHICGGKWTLGPPHTPAPGTWPLATPLRAGSWTATRGRGGRCGGWAVGTPGANADCRADHREHMRGCWRPRSPERRGAAPATPDLQRLAGRGSPGGQMGEGSGLRSTRPAGPLVPVVGLELRSPPRRGLEDKACSPTGVRGRAVRSKGSRLSGSGVRGPRNRPSYPVPPWARSLRPGDRVRAKPGIPTSGPASARSSLHPPDCPPAVSRRASPWALKLGGPLSNDRGKQSRRR